LGNEAAELEAELLAEMMADQSSAQVNAEDLAYNAYTEAGGRTQGMRESLSAELKKSIFCTCLM
jgi:hypothetical protein